MRLIALAMLPSLLVAQEILTTTKDQQALAVTIYNDNRALVRDQREVSLPAGDVNLAFQEVSGEILPETALLRNLSKAKGFWVNEQNFDFDLLTPQKLLEKYVGRKVSVITRFATSSQGEEVGIKEVTEDAEVLATNTGVVLKFKDRIETKAPGRIVFPDLPENLRARPTLVINLHSAEKRPQKLELSYLTHGLSWKADYVAELAGDEKTLDLNGWVTLTNKSGSPYPNATVQLVAGTLHRAAPEPRNKALFSAHFASVGIVGPAEESLFDYHLYTLERPTTLKENQTKQVALLAASTVPVRKEYVLRAPAFSFETPSELPDSTPVGVFLHFDNTHEAHLGMPLPNGIVRVYKADSLGRPQFVGEDTIEHTPKNESLRLKMGTAFDVTAHRKQTDFKNLGAQGNYKNVYESAYRIELKNAKKEPVTVTVLEPVRGDWEITEKSHEFTKESADTVKFLVTVPADGKAVLTYRARVRW